MGLRLEAWLGVECSGRADVWLAEQAAYDLWRARHAPATIAAQRRVRRMPAAVA
jgi:plasmid maintenance system antidote protein VapI